MQHKNLMISLNKILYKALSSLKVFNKEPNEIKEAAIIEYTLASFGIKSRVERVDFGKESNLFCLKIPYGIRVEEIEKLSKTIAMSVASKTGRVKVIAPIPGESCIGIEVPK